MAGERGFWGRIASDGIGGFVWDSIWRVIQYAAPFVAAGVTGVTGVYFDGFPWSVVLVFAGIVFATVASGLLRFDEWRLRRTLNGKFVYTGPLVFWDPIKNSKGKTIGMKNVQLSIGLFNKSNTRPISFVMDELHTSAESRIGPNEKRNDRGAVIAPESQSHYSDHPIIMDGVAPHTITGTIRFKLRYGNKGHEKYEIAKDISVTAHYDGTLGAFVRIDTTDNGTQ